MEWKLVKSDYLFDDLWFTVRKDTCMRGDGKIIDPYYVYEFPDWVSIEIILFLLNSNFVTGSYKRLKLQ